MANTITGDQFRQQLLYVLEETFEQVHGIFLDRGTSLFETLDGITAQEASAPVSSICASISDHIGHVVFYLERLEEYLRQQPQERVDWQSSWRTGPVTPEQWDAHRRQLKETYQRLIESIKGYDAWETENAIGGAIGLVAHTAYHLGEIRQALCTVRQ